MPPVLVCEAIDLAAAFQIGGNELISTDHSELVRREHAIATGFYSLANAFSQPFFSRCSDGEL